MMRRYSADFYAPDTGDWPCAKLDVQHFCRRFRVLTVHLKEVPNLIQQDAVRVFFLRGKILSPPRRFLCILHSGIFYSFGRLLRRGLQRFARLFPGQRRHMEHIGIIRR